MACYKRLSQGRQQLIVEAILSLYWTGRFAWRKSQQKNIDNSKCERARVRWSNGSVYALA